MSIRRLEDEPSARIINKAATQPYENLHVGMPPLQSALATGQCFSNTSGTTYCCSLLQNKQFASKRARKSASLRESPLQAAFSSLRTVIVSLPIVAFPYLEPAIRGYTPTPVRWTIAPI